MRSNVLLYGLATLQLAASLPVVPRDPSPNPIAPHGPAALYRPRPLPPSGPRFPNTSKREVDVDRDAAAKPNRDDVSITLKDIFRQRPKYGSKDRIKTAADSGLTSKRDGTQDITIDLDSSISTRDPQPGLVVGIINGVLGTNVNGNYGEEEGAADAARDETNEDIDDPSSESYVPPKPVQYDDPVLEERELPVNPEPLVIPDIPSIPEMPGIPGPGGFRRQNSEATLDASETDRVALSAHAQVAGNTNVNADASAKITTRNPHIPSGRVLAGLLQPVTEA